MDKEIELKEKKVNNTPAKIGASKHQIKKSIGKNLAGISNETDKLLKRIKKTLEEYMQKCYLRKEVSEKKLIGPIFLYFLCL